MKKFLLFICISLFFSCSGDDNSGSTGCHCDAIFSIENSEEVYHVEKNMELDCETKQPKYNPTSDPNAKFKAAKTSPLVLVTFGIYFVSLHREIRRYNIPLMVKNN